MAEELIPQAPAVETADSQESGQPTSEKQEKRQPKQETVSIEDFRKFQATKDREAALAQQRAQQAERKMMQMENELFQLRIQDRPEDEQQVAVLQRQLQQQAARAEQQAARAEQAEQYANWLQQQQQNNQKIDAALSKVVAKTGFPLEEARKIFMDTNDADEVWAAAHEWASDGRRKKRNDDDDDDPGVQRAKANRVDTGTGKATPNDRSALIRKAIADKDADGYYRAMLAKK
jgi:hypothetical protein